ncbi:hypothetical protein GOV13_05445 [Candidatus Pacearchaeota archaeon]|nr:hypothetical protein [Candidatus Pacearchaeota archaeon]
MTKYNLKITAVLLIMFILTQFIGLYVVNHYSSTKIVNGEVVEVDAPDLPFGLETPEVKDAGEFNEIFISIIFAFIIAITLLFLLTKFRIAFVLKLWFFVVVIIALGISFNSVLSPLGYATTISLIIAIPLAFIKIYRREFLVHNITELLVYPGIAAVFVPILNIYTIIALLVLISVYDMWAVWHSGIMQKMAKYQIDKLNIFGGFFVPYTDKKTKKKINLFKARYKDKKVSKEKFKAKKFKMNVAILGGGDVIFPIIAAGVMFKTFGLASALLVTLGATLGIGYLFFFAEKKKFYPAMPYITAGIFLGMLTSWALL